MLKLLQLYSVELSFSIRSCSSVRPDESYFDLHANFVNIEALVFLLNDGLLSKAVNTLVLFVWFDEEVNCSMSSSPNSPDIFFERSYWEKQKSIFST